MRRIWNPSDSDHLSSKDELHILMVKRWYNPQLLQLLAPYYHIIWERSIKNDEFVNGGDVVSSPSNCSGQTDFSNRIRHFTTEFGNLALYNPHLAMVKVYLFHSVSKDRINIASIIIQYSSYIVVSYCQCYD